MDVDEAAVKVAPTFEGLPPMQITEPEHDSPAAPSNGLPGLGTWTHSAIETPDSQDAIMKTCSQGPENEPVASDSPAIALIQQEQHSAQSDAQQAFSLKTKDLPLTLGDDPNHGTTDAQNGDSLGQKVAANPEDPSARLISTLLSISQESKPTLHDLPFSNENGTENATSPTTNNMAVSPLDLPIVNHSGDVNGTTDAAVKNPEDAEFEMDSSPYVSSTDDSSDSSSDDDDEDDDDYVMLGPAEQARLLMEGDGGSEDEGARKSTGDPQLRTANEKPDEVVQVPNVTVTENTKIEELGNVEHTIENVILISAKTSGEYRVLESGSVLCLGQKTIIGVVSETLGRVQQPFYSVRFPNPSAIEDAGISKGTTIFYIPEHSKFVFTQALKAVKGSDASNIHDEEIGAEEVEFSDDEAEAEHKRRLKAKKQARKDDRASSDTGYSRPPRGGASTARQWRGDPSTRNADVTNLKYDDGDDELYTPLSRPSNFHQEMQPDSFGPERSSVNSNHNSRGRRDYNRGGSTGRGGDRGRGRGRGGAFNRGRGDSTPQGRPPPPARLDLPQPPTPGSAGFVMPSPQWSASPSTPSQYGEFPGQSPRVGSFHPQPSHYGPMHSAHHSPTYPMSPAVGPPSFQAPYTQPPHQSPCQHPHQPQHQPPYQAPQQPYFQHPNYAAFPPSGPHNAPIPPGAFVNPAFFTGTSPAPSPVQGMSNYGTGYPSQDHPQYSHMPATTLAGGAAFQAAQDRLDVLRRLSGPQG